MKWEHKEVDGRTVSTLGKLKKIFASEVKVGDKIADLVVYYNVLDVAFVEGTVLLEVEETIGAFTRPSKLIEKPSTFRFTLMS